jgi:hypothetical protein
MKRESIRCDHRRRFLKLAGFAAGAGTLLALDPRQRSTAAEETDAAVDESRKGGGYRLTAHIRSYYQKAGS